ncbi:MAG: hypothetical protein V3S20_08745 [Dehalococcoidia bacterium]
MGVGSFPITNPTVTGGSEFLDLLDRFRSLLNNRQLGQAAVGQDLFSSLLGAQLQANRRPISIVDQLMLQGQVGSQSPLSQASDERLARFTRPGEDPRLQSLFDRLDIFSGGMNTPAPALLAHGGQLVVDPNKKKSGGVGTVAGPVTINDSTGQTVAVAGEAGGAETIDVQPVPDSVAKVKKRFGDGVFIGEIQGAVQEHTTQKGEKAVATTDLSAFNLSRSERFRAEELLRLRPDLDAERIVAIARHPEGLQALIGGPPDPRMEAAQRLSDSIGNDNRFSDAFVRSLAIGRSPRPTEATARDVTTLSPFNLDILKGIIGEDLFSQFAFELSDQSPLGTRARQATVGGVRV